MMFPYLPFVNPNTYEGAIFMIAKVAGGNDNGKPLTTVEKFLAKKYKDDQS